MFVPTPARAPVPRERRASCAVVPVRQHSPGGPPTTARSGGVHSRPPVRAPRPSAPAVPTGASGVRPGMMLQASPRLDVPFGRDACPTMLFRQSSSSIRQDRSFEPAPRALHYPANVRCRSFEPLAAQRVAIAPEATPPAGASCGMGAGAWTRQGTAIGRPVSLESALTPTLGHCISTCRSFEPLEGSVASQSTTVSRNRSLERRQVPQPPVPFYSDTRSRSLEQGGSPEVSRARSLSLELAPALATQVGDVAPAREHELARRQQHIELLVQQERQQEHLQERQQPPSQDDVGPVTAREREAVRQGEVRPCHVIRGGGRKVPQLRPPTASGLWRRRRRRRCSPQALAAAAAAGVAGRRGASSLTLAVAGRQRSAAVAPGHPGAGERRVGRDFAPLLSDELCRGLSEAVLELLGVGASAAALSRCSRSTRLSVVRALEPFGATLRARKLRHAAQRRSDARRLEESWRLEAVADAGKPLAKAASGYATEVVLGRGCQVASECVQVANPGLAAAAGCALLRAFFSEAIFHA